jgi:hypothetical protein
MSAWETSATAELRVRFRAKLPPDEAQLIELQPNFSNEYVLATYPFRETADAALYAEGLSRAGWRH